MKNKLIWKIFMMMFIIKFVPDFYYQSNKLFGTQSVEAFDPALAYEYAEKYWDKVCSDGYFFEMSYPPSYLGPGASLPITNGLDCAHYVSCCIGNEPHEQGGGLIIPSRTNAYGEPGADNLGDWLLNTDAQEVSSVEQLSKGDVINYDWDGDGHWDHAAFYLGGLKISAHSTRVWNTDWDLGGADNYRFIKIAIVSDFEWNFNQKDADFEIKFENWKIYNNERYPTENPNDASDIAIVLDNESNRTCLVINPGFDPQLISPDLNFA